MQPQSGSPALLSLQRPYLAELHERAFRRLGGATRIVVLDNLREGVLVPDIYDPALNPLYRDVLAHYGAVAMQPSETAVLDLRGLLLVAAKTRRRRISRLSNYLGQQNT